MGIINNAMPMNRSFLILSSGWHKLQNLLKLGKVAFISYYIYMFKDKKYAISFSTTLKIWKWPEARAQ